MKYQFPQANPSKLGINQHSIKAIQKFNNSYTGHQRLDPEVAKAFIKAGNALKHAIENNCTFEKAMQDIEPDHK